MYCNIQQYSFSTLTETYNSQLLVKVLCPTRHKIGHFKDISQANLLAWYGKTKAIATTTHIHLSKEMYNNTK